MKPFFRRRPRNLTLSTENQAAHGTTHRSFCSRRRRISLKQLRKRPLICLGRSAAQMTDPSSWQATAPHRCSFETRASEQSTGVTIGSLWAAKMPQANVSSRGARIRSWEPKAIFSSKRSVENCYLTTIVRRRFSCWTGHLLFGRRAMRSKATFSYLTCRAKV